MSDPALSAVILEPLALVVGALRSVPWSRLLSLAGAAVALPVRLLLVPLSFVFSLVLGILFAVFAPVLYILAYVFSWIRAVFSFVASLQPLYTFFGVAACVGIVAGLTLVVSSSVITSALGMEDDSQQPQQTKQKRYLEDASSSKEDSSSNEAEWQWLEPSPSRRRPASGLLSQTIHEEDDDSEAAL